ncbi:hypothetical protein GCM10007170_36320 [Arthrobacter liuii]|uniref:Uncharacterized protein n=1 Tax=Arthrobacter liuii TaxID=1476996 RepID=A0ABQ2AZT9_9MICC|nr:hypothetical protein GCM10007170_36320 [Arthrobacter liuii]
METGRLEQRIGVIAVDWESMDLKLDAAVAEVRENAEFCLGPSLQLRINRQSKHGAVGCTVGARVLSGHGRQQYGFFR